MENNLRLRSSYRSRIRGFSLVELLVVVAMIFIITGMSLPSFFQAYRSYQVNDAAMQMAGILKFTRFEAIRMNTPISCLIRQPGTTPVTTNVWTDTDGNGVQNSIEKQILFSGAVGPLAAANVPGTSTLSTAAGLGTLTAVSLTAGNIQFDARGAVTSTAVNVIYLGNATAASAGYRAVIILPSGSIYVWSADSSGNWKQVN